MSYPQYGYPYPHHVSQLLVSSGHGSTGTSSSNGMMSIAGTGSASGAAPSTGTVSGCYGVTSATTAGSHGVCGCAQCVDYPRLATAHHSHQIPPPPHPATSAYTSAYADQAYASQVTMHETSAFYSPLGSHYMIKDGNGDVGPWQTVGQPTGYYPYDPSLTPYGYGYDLNAAARRKNATRETTSTLKAWLNEHKKNPYPTKGEKIMLAIITKMTLTQVSTWFANARRRLKKENKMTWEQKGKEDDDDGDGDGDGDGEVSGGGDEEDEEVKPSAVVAQGEEDPDGEDSADKCGDSSEPSETSTDATGSHVMHTDADRLQQSGWHENINNATRVTHHASVGPIGLPQSSNSLGIAGYPDRVSMSQDNEPVKPKIWSLADTATCKTPPSTMPKMRSSFMSSWNTGSNNAHQDYRHHVGTYNSAYMSTKSLPSSSNISAPSYPTRTLCYPMDSHVVQTDTPPQTPPNLKCSSVENFGGQRVLVNSLNTRLREIQDDRSVDVNASVSPLQPGSASMFGGVSRMNPSAAVFKPVYKSPYQNGHVRVV